MKKKPWYRQRRLTIGAAVVIALAATLMVLNHFQIITLFNEEIPLGHRAEWDSIDTNWPIASANWQLTFSDEFDGSGAPDSSKWEVQEYNRRDNKQGPDGWWLKDNVYQDGNGHLIITFDKIANRNDDGDSHDYATGMVRSKNLFEQTYGKFEIRCQLPREQGWWVAFWLMADGASKASDSGRQGAEIDIFEAFGWHNKVLHTVHWGGYGKNHKSLYQQSQLEDRQAFHTFTLIWTPTEYQYYVDGEITWVTKAGGVSSVNQYIKITGESSTYDWFATEAWAEDPAAANLPDQFKIDYIRVYSYSQN